MAEKKKQNAFVAFFRETKGELDKVSWPTWREVRQLTGLVLLVMVIMGAILGITDGAAHSVLNSVLGLS